VSDAQPERGTAPAERQLLRIQGTFLAGRAQRRIFWTLLLVIWYMGYWLYRRKIFFKL